MSQKFSCGFWGIPLPSLRLSARILGWEMRERLAAERAVKLGHASTSFAASCSCSLARQSWFWLHHGAQDACTRARCDSAGNIRMSACMGRWTCAVGVLWLLSHAADHNERASISAVAVLWSDGQPTGPCVRVMRLVASLCVYMCVSLSLSLSAVFPVEAKAIIGRRCRTTAIKKNNELYHILYSNRIITSLYIIQLVSL